MEDEKTVEAEELRSDDGWSHSLALLHLYSMLEVVEADNQGTPLQTHCLPEAVAEVAWAHC